MPRSGNKEDQICGSNWSVTYWFDTENSPSKAKVDEYIDIARQAGYIINGQIEKAPTTGNLHYQLQVKTPWTRKSAVKKMLPTAWIEKTKKDVALQQYVKKEDTRVAPLLDADDKYPTTNKLWELIYREYDVLEKYGWNYDNEDEVELYSGDDQKTLEGDPLAFFDKVMGRLIRRGYYVDMLASNPAIRSFWKKFWRDVLFRTRETVRQTDKQNELISETLNIPTIDGQDSGSDSSSSRPSAEEGSDSEDYEDGESEASSGWNQSIGHQTDADSDGEGSGE
jgi:hypothetical protein